MATNWDMLIAEHDSKLVSWGGDVWAQTIAAFRTGKRLEAENSRLRGGLELREKAATKLASEVRQLKSKLKKWDIAVYADCTFRDRNALNMDMKLKHGDHLRIIRKE